MKTASNHPRTKRQQWVSIAAVLLVFGVAAFSFLPAESAGVVTGAKKSAGTRPAPPSVHGEEYAADADADDSGGAPDAAAQANDKPSAPSDGCVKCHTGVGDPHATKLVNGPSCIDCHGGNGAAAVKSEAHTARPTYPKQWPSSANPKEAFTLQVKENLDWIRFVNPSDLRTADLACGKCHGPTVRALKKTP
jgi:hypothetical protein